MGKAGKRVAFMAVLTAVVLLFGLVTDRVRLRRELLRLHVVAASDSQTDQQVKLTVRDAVLGSLQQGLRDLTDPRQAFDYVEQMLPKIEETANRALEAAGVSQRATVSLGKEAFPEREYDTFSLPAGVYNALRVVIGEGEGKNWWCVVFPQLCYGAPEEGFQEKSHIPDSLYDTITGKYEIRFWLLDKLGQLENIFFHASEAG